MNDNDKVAPSPSEHTTSTVQANHSTSLPHTGADVEEEIFRKLDRLFARHYLDGIFARQGHRAFVASSIQNNVLRPRSVHIQPR